MDTWFLLYGGESADGVGPGVYVGRTTDPNEAVNYELKRKKNPYSTGYVLIVTDTTTKRLTIDTNINK